MRVGAAWGVVTTGRLLSRAPIVPWSHSVLTRTVCTACIDAEPKRAETPLRIKVAQGGELTEDEAADYYGGLGRVDDSSLIDGSNCPTRSFTEALFADAALGRPINILELGATLNPQAGILAGHASIVQRLRHDHRRINMKLVQTDLLSIRKEYGPFFKWRINQNIGRWMTLPDAGVSRSLIDVAIERFMGAHPDRTQLMMAPYDMQQSSSPASLRDVTGIDTYRWIIGAAILCHCDQRSTTTCGGHEPTAAAMVDFITTHILPQLDRERGVAVLTGRAMPGRAKDFHVRSKFAAFEAADRINRAEYGFEASVASLADIRNKSNKTGFELRIFASPSKLRAAVDKTTVEPTESKPKPAARALRS